MAALFIFSTNWDSEATKSRTWSLPENAYPLTCTNTFASTAWCHSIFYLHSLLYFLLLATFCDSCFFLKEVKKSCHFCFSTISLFCRQWSAPRGRWWFFLPENWTEGILFWDNRRRKRERRVGWASIEKVVVGWAWRSRRGESGWGGGARDTGRVFVQVEVTSGRMEGRHSFVLLRQKHGDAEEVDDHERLCDQNIIHRYTCIDFLDSNQSNTGYTRQKGRETNYRPTLNVSTLRSVKFTS